MPFLSLTKFNSPLPKNYQSIDYIKFVLKTYSPFVIGHFKVCRLLNKLAGNGFTLWRGWVFGNISFLLSTTVD